MGFIGAFIASLAASVTAGQQEPTPTAVLNGIPWRHIGPAAFGGRIDDVEAVPGRPQVIFVGAASGGIFKSVNSGTTWKPVFDEAGTMLSIGDLAIAPSDGNIVWAGTGEPNGRQSSSWGDGVYKSLDGGETWTHAGLRETHHVGRVVIHPRNPDIVFVAALGRLWGPNPERGLYRTHDGGRTWKRVLTIDQDTGVVDVAMDRDGRTLFAAAYQRRRRAWGFVGGGSGSALYRSLDGGETWQKLGGGLPDGNVGRIGVEISRSEPDVVYAIVEHKDGGVFRSQDRGTTWTRQNPLNPRPSYYSQIRIDPTNANKVWVLGSPLFVSVDGGKTFRSNDTGDRIHVDHHALWINPANPEHLILGNDGGLYFSHDGSRSWSFIDNLPIGQYYDISIDKREPYWVYGGTQDNGTWALPSRTYSELGITNNDVINIAYGDGFYTIPDPSDARVIYANSQSGRTYRVDLETREERGIRPVSTDPKEEYRFNWSTPMVMSPHDPKVVYYGGNRLFRTTDGGQRWEVISPELTRNQDWKKLPVMGPARSDATLSRDDGVSDLGTITTISESPARAGLLYAGTDDGQVQVTIDGGKTWQNHTARFKLPGERWVSRVLASRHAAGTAYVAFDGHQDDDFKPYLFRTTDTGATWTAIAGDLPDGTVINTIEEHHRKPGLLFAGTESGLFVSHDGGRGWALMRGNLPRVPIDDIAISERENDVVLGTHGRSIIILDDASLLEHSAPPVFKAAAHLFPLRTAVQYYELRSLPVPGASEFSGPNPPAGALITYFLRDDPPAPAKPADDGAPDAAGAPGAAAAVKATEPQVKLTISAPDGTLVRELEGPDKKGINRVAWDLRYLLPFTPIEGDDGWFGKPKGTFVLPGDYTVRLRARGMDLSQNVTVRVDPRSQTTPAALDARFKASRAVSELQRAFVDADALAQSMHDELERVRKLLKDGPEHAAIKSTHEALAKKVAETRDKLKGGWGGPRFRIFDLAGQLQASTAGPTEAQLRTLERLSADVTATIGTLNTIATSEFPAFEKSVAGAVSPVLKPVRVPGKAGL
ncbi:MAG: hypothetical protein ABIP65_10135 [Vicinamibacterales bacterium]